ncbi:hypothetical protein NE237_012626 [Protea cynaroides]|uniref:Uncharacterized protein n=1 Tax=Protea cynaroides TaxID=273540 RepID=A0A9Q0GXU3_9MAGN|nr:hypothetical protein NE237_012626 [Protea cynaroides]
MIQPCSCSGGPASTIEPIRKRILAASCKNCGGKPLVDCGGFLSGSMLSTGGLELTSVINPDLSWKTVSKGNRSVSRRARRPILGNYKRSGALIDRDPEKVEDMPVSESEKLGVTILGRRFSDKVEHIPIKKRRFFFRSPSPPPPPPPWAPSPQPEESDQFTNGQHASGQEFSLNQISGRKFVAVDTAAARLGQVVDIGISSDKINSKEIKENLCDNEDFSGISILAAVACNNNVDDGTDNAEDGSAVEVSSTQERSFDVLAKYESCNVVEEPCKDHSVDCAEISNEGTESCISAIHVDETNASLVTDVSSPEDLAYKTNAAATSSIGNPLSAKPKLPSERNEASSRGHESLRDDRSHWDLNTVMDAWDCHFDSIVGPQEGGISGISDDGCNKKAGKLETWKCPSLDPIVGPQEDGLSNISDGGCTKKVGKLEACEQQRESAATKLDIANPVQPVVGNVVDDGHEGICFHSKSSSMGREKSDPEVQKAVSHASEGKCDRTTCFQGKASSSETNSALNGLMSMDDGSKSLHDQEWTTSMSVHQFDDKDTCLNHPVLPLVDKIIDTPVSEENGDADSAVTTEKETGDDCPADAERAENICSSPCGIGKALTEDGEDAGLHDNVNSPNKPHGSDLMAYNPLQSGPSDSVMDHAVSNSDKVHCSLSTKCEELAGSLAVCVDLKVQDGKDFVVKATDDSPGQIESEELECKLSAETTGTVETPGGISSHEAYKSYTDDLVKVSENVAPEDYNFDDVDYGSDVSPDDPQRLEKEIELQAGYDSQYEDGEFREPVLHGWEGNACEEGEAEHVGYGSDNREAYDFEAEADHLGSLSSETNDVCKTNQVMEKNMPENNVLKAGYCENSSGTANIHSRWHFGKQDDQTDSKVDNELRGGADKVNGDVELYARRDAGKDSIQSASSGMKFTGCDRLPECSKSYVDAKMEGRDGNFKRIHSVSRIDGLDSGDSVARMAKTSRCELLSRIEGPTTSDFLLRKDRSNNLDDSNRRVERVPASAQSIRRGGSSSLHMHGRGRGSDCWVDSSRWGPERHRSPGFGHPAPKNAAAAAAAKIESSGFVVAPDGTVVKAGGLGRHSVNASLGGVRRSFTRRGSSSDRNEFLGMHMELCPVVETSPDRSITVERGRSGRFGPQVVGAGLRERYQGPSPDDSCLRMQHPLVTRERSYSPIQRRGAPRLSRSRTKSPSRSRTRSPHAWPSPRGRDGCVNGSGPGLRHHSRSPPNFRSEARMERVRPPHRRPGFLADHIAGFAPTSRIRGSPQYSSRWVENRRDHVDHFGEHGYKPRSSVLERRSPRRIFPRGHRFDLVGSMGRSKPDDYYRSIHPGRFPEKVGAGRGSRYDESDDDRRKHGHRYGFVHPVRRYDTDGPVKRFRYDVEDLAAHDSHNKEAAEFHGRGSPKTYDRSIDSRLGDAPRRSREEKSHFRYDRDWKYDSNSKSFGM